MDVIHAPKSHTLVRSTSYIPEAGSSYIFRNPGKGVHERNLPITPDQRETLDRFLTSLAGKSPATKRIYKQNLTHMLAFVETIRPGLPVESMTREHVETWVQFLLGEGGYSPSSVKSFVQAGRLFCKKLVRDDVLEQNPFDAADIALPDAPAPDVAVITTEDFQAMLNAAGKEKSVWGKRDRAMMAVLYYCGFRRDELLNIHREHIDWSRQTIKITRGKGGDPRTVGVDYIAMNALDQYDSARKKYLSGLRAYKRQKYEAAPIWLSHRGTLGENGLAEALELRARQAGITKPVHPHIWRHSSATADADHGMTDAVLRDKYGWSPTSSMPYRYTRSTQRERAIERSRSIRGDDGVKL